MKLQRWVLACNFCLIIIASGCWSPGTTSSPNSPNARPNASGGGPISVADDQGDRKIYMWSEDPRVNDGGPTYSPRDSNPIPPEKPIVKRIRECAEAKKAYEDSKGKWGPRDPYTVECFNKYKVIQNELDEITRSVHAVR